MTGPRRSSATESGPASVSHVAFAVVTFLVLGVGTTLSVFLGVALAGPTVVDVAGGRGSVALLATLLLAPLLAVVTGLRTGRAVADAGRAALGAGVGAFLGAAASTAVVAGLTALFGALGGSGGESGLVAFLAPTAGYVLGVGLTGTAAGYLGWRFDRG